MTGNSTCLHGVSVSLTSKVIAANGVITGVITRSWFNGGPNGFVTSLTGFSSYLDDNACT